MTDVRRSKEFADYDTVRLSSNRSGYPPLTNLSPTDSVDIWNDY